MRQPDGDRPPLADSVVLGRLRAEVDDFSGVWQVFIGAFITQLPRRVARLRLALTTADVDGAVDAVLSLKTSSQMVGAERLADLAGDLERSLRDAAQNDDPEVALPHLAAAHLKQIRRCSEQTANLLTDHFHERPGGS